MNDLYVGLRAKCKEIKAILPPSQPNPFKPKTTPSPPATPSPTPSPVVESEPPALPSNYPLDPAHIDIKSDSPGEGHSLLTPRQVMKYQEEQEAKWKAEQAEEPQQRELQLNQVLERRIEQLFVKYARPSKPTPKTLSPSPEPDHPPATRALLQRNRELQAEMEQYQWREQERDRPTAEQVREKEEHLQVLQERERLAQDNDLLRQQHQEQQQRLTLLTREKEEEQAQALATQHRDWRRLLVEKEREMKARLEFQHQELEDIQAAYEKQRTEEELRGITLRNPRTSTLPEEPEEEEDKEAQRIARAQGRI